MLSCSPNSWNPAHYFPGIFPGDLVTAGFIASARIRSFVNHLDDDDDDDGSDVIDDVNDAAADVVVSSPEKPNWADGKNEGDEGVSAQDLHRDHEQVSSLKPVGRLREQRCFSSSSWCNY